MSHSFPELFGPEAVDSPLVAMPPRKTVLNVGCGPRTITVIGTAFPAAEWQELRLDINPAADPDIVASMTDMPAIPDGAVDAVWSSHNLEHLDPHEVPQALHEFLRVLRPGGQLLLAVPDLQAVARLVFEDRLDEPLYQSGAGPIFPLDVVYGYAPAIAAGNRFMAHRTGFTPRMLSKALQEAGFDAIALWRRAEAYELQVRAYRPLVPANALNGMVQQFPTA